MKGVFLDLDTMAPSDLDLTALEALPVEWHYYDLTRPEETAQRIAGAGIVISNKVVLDRELILNATSDSASDPLGLIAVAATGTNNVDLSAARSRNVAVTNVSGYAASTVAQHSFALMLALSANLFNYANAVKRGRWAKQPFFCMLDYPIHELAGKNLLLLGYGAIGRKVAAIAAAFDMNVMIARSLNPDARDSGREPFEHLLPHADIVSLHCPLTEQTKQIINARTLAMMKPGALLINTARGGLIEETALLRALQSKQITGAGLDGLSQEPPPDDHPLITAELDNLILTPHCAWASQTSRQKIVDELALSVDAFLRGSLYNSVL